MPHAGRFHLVNTEGITTQKQFTNFWILFRHICMRQYSFSRKSGSFIHSRKCPISQKINLHQPDFLDRVFFILGYHHSFARPLQRRIFLDRIWRDHYSTRMNRQVMRPSHQQSGMTKHLLPLQWPQWATRIMRWC